jgi:hypothetical protein
MTDVDRCVNRYMLNIVSSAIVNTPPPGALIKLVGKLGAKKHKTLHYIDTDEAMVQYILCTPSRSSLTPYRLFLAGRRVPCGYR